MLDIVLIRVPTIVVPMSVNLNEARCGARSSPRDTHTGVLAYIYTRVPIIATSPCSFHNKQMADSSQLPRTTRILGVGSIRF